MKTSHRSRVLGVAGLATVGVALSLAGSACKSQRTVFGGSEGTFVDEPAVDAGECPLQCSLDGRSVIRSCDGEIVETCAADLACGAAACQEPCAAAAADKSSNGCEFFFQLPRYDPATFSQSCVATFVVNTSLQPVDLKLAYEGKELDLSGALFRTNPGETSLVPHTGPIAPGESAILFVSDRDPAVAPPKSPTDGLSGRIACPTGVVPALRTELPGGTRIASAMHLTANVPIGLSMIYPFGGATSYVPTATLLLPVSTWATQNMIVSAWEANFSRPGTQIYASEDDTEITILPTADIEDGVGVKGTRKKVPVTYRLDRGQFLQLAQREELSGSVVESTKPVATFVGHGCAAIPSGFGPCDSLQQQIPPFEQWGSEYVGVGYRPRMGNEHEPMAYRIVAARDGTQLDYDPEIPAGAPTTLSAGEMALFTHGTGDAFVVRTQDAEHPIYVGAYMSSSGRGFNELAYNGAGDPEFVNVIPSGQYLNSYSFYADPTYGDSSLVIVRAKTRGEFKDVWLECAGETLSDFRPIGTRGEYEFTRVDLAKSGRPGQKFGDRVCRNGLQRLKSDGPFTATVWGWDYCASYAYPGGMALRKLVHTPLDPIR